MATKKRILVKHLLELIPEHEEVEIEFFAYGFHYAYSHDSGKTSEELKENLNYDCLNAEVKGLFEMLHKIRIDAELVHV